MQTAVNPSLSVINPWTWIVLLPDYLYIGETLLAS